MGALRSIRRAIKASITPAVFAGLAAYFGWNATQGAHGTHAYRQQLALREDALHAQQDAQSERDIWTRRVASLNERALDGDMLDERSRAMLNLARPGDLVIPYGPHDTLY